MPLLRFKYIDGRDFHVEDFEDSESSVGSENYIIRLFGRTPLVCPDYPDKSVCITVTGFTPFFFVKMPSDWNKTHVKRFYNQLHDKNKDLIKYDVGKKFDFSEFKGNNQESNFIQLVFRTAKAMRNCVFLLSKPYYFGSKRLSLSLYESNIDPILKLMHIKSITGCSWISIDDKNIEHCSDKETYCDIEGVVDWNDINSSVEDNENGTYCQLRILSYDIETMSTCPNGGFPLASREGDNVIQVGMTFNYFQKSECYKKYLLSYLESDPIEEAQVINCETEKELLQKFIKVLIKEDPDVITGYNIFGFDNKFMYDRASRYSPSFLKTFSEWGRLKNHQCKFITKSLSSSALGDNTLYFLESEGRVQIDLYKVLMRDHNLETYKLDHVSSHFNQNDIKNLNTSESTFETPNVSGLEQGGYFKVKIIETLSGVEDFYTEEKFKVVSIEGKTITYSGPQINVNLDDYKLKWCMAKDDLPAKKIFEYWPIDSYHRKIIGKYCIKDCVLVNFLMEKLDILSTNMAMSYVCWVPLYYIFIRGQGIKAFSLVAQQCRKDNFIVPAIKKADYIDIQCKATGEFCTVVTDSCTFEDCSANLDKIIYIKEFETGERACVKCNRLQYYQKYEGAKVYEPTPGVYWEPISVLDYASLYPRSIISRNMSWETQVLDTKYDNLPNYKYYEVSYKDSLDKIVTCRFAQEKDSSPPKLGIIPKILFNLLNERDATKKKMKKESDAFKKKILDGHQLALKITANSLYGQLGAITSQIYRKDIAACTTAVGQEMLGVAQDFMENKFVNEMCALVAKPEDFPNVNAEELDFVKMVFDTYSLNPKIIYGDTDSVFVNFQLRDHDNNKQMERTGREICIKLGLLAGKLVKKYLDYPHDLEYEKTFHPWLVLCKKKYAGAKYEENPDKYSMNYMGIVLKRRDNAKIVKKVCGGILNILFKERDYTKVQKYTQEMLLNVVNGLFDITYFITTKKLGGTYKGAKLTSDKKGTIGEDGSWNWDDVKCGQAHVKLCQRMKARNAAPQVNDRISFVQVFDKEDEDAKNRLQGDKIEEASYVLENKLQIDYLYYIENQIENPACQFLELIINNPAQTIFKPIKEEILMARKTERLSVNGAIFKKPRGGKQSKSDKKEISPKTQKMISKLKAPQPLLVKVKSDDQFDITF
jgi:DNA polymerase elongation subunit (family B)